MLWRSEANGAAPTDGGNAGDGLNTVRLAMRVGSRTHRNELPAIFRQLFAITPLDLCRRRLNALEERERRNPLLGRYFDEKYSMERALYRMLAYRRPTGRYPTIGGTGGHRAFQALFVRKRPHPRLR